MTVSADVWLAEVALALRERRVCVSVHAVVEEVLRVAHVDFIRHEATLAPRLERLHAVVRAWLLLRQWEVEDRYEEHVAAGRVCDAEDAHLCYEDAVASVYGGPGALAPRTRPAEKMYSDVFRGEDDELCV